VREYKEKWTRDLDVPPMRWFKEPLTEGALKGSVLDIDKYNGMLSAYYKRRDWDERGIPTQSTMERLGLTEEAKQLDAYVKLKNEPIVSTTLQNKPFP
jgi:aldehyde:ferredoxin oxidoreductase